MEFLKQLFGMVAKTDISKIWDDIFGSASTPSQFNIEDFPNLFGDKVEKIILDKEKESGTSYVGGNFNVEYIDDKNYRCAFDLYFEDKDGKVNKSSAASDPLSTSNLTPKALQELQAARIIKFEIPDPNENKPAQKSTKTATPPTSKTDADSDLKKD